MTDFQKAAKELDNIICLFCLRENKMDYYCVEQALLLIQKAAIPITVSLSNYLKNNPELKYVGT